MTNAPNLIPWVFPFIKKWEVAEKAPVSARHVFPRTPISVVWSAQIMHNRRRNLTSSSARDRRVSLCKHWGRD